MSVRDGGGSSVGFKCRLGSFLINLSLYCQACLLTPPNKEVVYVPHPKK